VVAKKEDDGDFSGVVAKNVRRLREKKRMTRPELSDAIGGSHSYVYHVEELKKMPSLLMGLRIARTLGVAPERLLE
jgi:transcriptional regulator with XRE-family HTH domain